MLLLSSPPTDPMLVDPPNTKRFLNAPPSVAAAVAAFMEPAIAAGLLWLMHVVYAQPFEGPSIALALFAVLMLAPGHNRIGQTGVGLWIDIVLGWIPVVVVLGLGAWATRSYHQFDRDMLLAWTLATPVVQGLAYRAATAALLQRLKQPEMQRPTVIVGAGPVCGRVAEMLHARSRYGWRLLGVFDDRAPERLGLPPEMPFHGPVAGLASFIDHHGVKDVFITLPLTSQPRIVQLLEMLQNTTASVHYVPDVFGASIIQGRLEDMDGLPVVGLLITPFTGVNGLIKRASDIVLASLIVLLISPLLLVVAAGVKLSSPGPAIFRQRRNGLDGEVIEVYKFRSMTTQDNGNDVKQATRDDKRVTPFGRFIRRTSLDELPQFFNVLQGSMSIVGPRPHAVAHNTQYRQLVKAYMARHKVKPGITGWAQVNGLRGETDTLEKMQQRVAYDLEYLRNWSLGLDLLIIARTAKQVLRNKNVY